MIATRIMELRKRRGLMIAIVADDYRVPGALPLYSLPRPCVLAAAPARPQAAIRSSGSWTAGFLPTFGFIVAATLGCTAGSRDLTEGMFRHLVVTGRSRLALYLARIPAGLAIVVPLVAIGYTILCAVCAFAAPTVVTDNGVNIPPGLSRAGFANGPGATPSWSSAISTTWGQFRGCRLPQRARPGRRCRRATPGQAAPAPIEALAMKVRSRPRPLLRLPAAFCAPPRPHVMIKGGLWMKLEATVEFVLELGLASLIGGTNRPVDNDRRVPANPHVLLSAHEHAESADTIRNARLSGWPWRTWNHPACQRHPEGWRG